MKVGDKIIQPYPFQKIQLWTPADGNKYWEWQAGCKSNTEDGPAVFEGNCIPWNYFTCDKEGLIEIEAISIAEMPGRYRNRVICKRKTTNPEGVEKLTGLITVTDSKFESWQNGSRVFPCDYEAES